MSTAAGEEEEEKAEVKVILHVRHALSPAAALLTLDSFPRATICYEGGGEGGEEGGLSIILQQLLFLSSRATTAVKTFHCCRNSSRSTRSTEGTLRKIIHQLQVLVLGRLQLQNCKASAQRVLMESTECVTAV